MVHHGPGGAEDPAAATTDFRRGLTAVDQAGLNEHWSQLDRAAERDFRAAALNRLVASALDPAEPVLDAGCGVGSFVLDRLRAGCDALGIEQSEEMLALGRRRLVGAGFPADRLRHRGLAEQAAAEPAAAVQVVCLDVIEHIPDDRAAVGHLLAMLQPGGRLVLTVPAVPGLYGAKDVALGHYRRYDSRALLALFDRTLWEIESLRNWNALGVPVTWFAVRVRRRAVDERFRTGRGGALYRCLGSALRWWFRAVENRVHPPVGLTLVLVARRRNGGQSGQPGAGS